MVQLIQVIKVTQVVQVVWVVQVVTLARTTSLDDMHSENIWLSWYKPSKYVTPVTEDERRTEEESGK